MKNKFILILSCIIFLSVSSNVFADRDRHKHSKREGHGKPFRSLNNKIKNLQQQIDTIKLTPGPQGPVGLTGPQGTEGTVGLTGPQGAEGPIGLTGSQGADGPAGLTGPQGVEGPTGLAGPAGPQGPAGADGIPGPDNEARDAICHIYDLYSLELPTFCVAVEPVPEPPVVTTCTLNSFETRSCGVCNFGSQTRICAIDGTWGAWGICQTNWPPNQPCP